jgi:hypothetical protein
MLRQRARKAKFVPVGVSHVEKAFAPLGSTRQCVRLIPVGDHTGMQGVNIGYAEDHAAPPAPLPPVRFGGEVQVAGPARKLLNVALSPPWRSSKPSAS